MIEPNDFLRCSPPATGNLLADLRVHLRLIAEFVPWASFPGLDADGDCVVCKFASLAHLREFLHAIGERALDTPTLIPYLNSQIDWTFGLEIDFGGVANWSWESVEPIMRLDRDAIVALAVAVAFDHWFEEGEDRSLLLPS